MYPGCALLWSEDKSVQLQLSFSRGNKEQLLKRIVTIQPGYVD